MIAHKSVMLNKKALELMSANNNIAKLHNLKSMEAMTYSFTDLNN